MWRNSVLRAAALALGVALLAGHAGAEPAPASATHAPPPVDAFLSNALSLPALSPSGRYLAYDLTVGVVDQLVVTDLQTKTSKTLFKTKPPTDDLADQDARQEIVAIRWKGEDRLIVSLVIPTYEGHAGPVHQKAKVSGYDVAHFATTRDGSKTILLTRGLGLGSAVLDTLRNDPDHVLTEVRAADGRLFAFRIDVTNGSSTQVEQGGTRVIGFGVNRKGEIVTRYLLGGSGGLLSTYYTILQGRQPGEKDWTNLFEIHPKDMRALSDIDFLTPGEKPDSLLVTAHQDAAPTGDANDTRAVRLFDMSSRTLGPVLFSNAKYDVEGVIVNPSTGALQAGCYWADVRVCEFRDPALGATYDSLSRYFGGDRSFDIFSQSDDDSRWVVLANGPSDPGTFYIYDRKTKAMDELGGLSPGLDAAALGHTRRFDYKARDGAALSGYLTLPPQAPGAAPPPLVVLPHGGPEARDTLSWDVFAQYLASRGYAVLQPNFRGSSGFGRKFAEAGYGQWGGRMSQDLDDAVKAVLDGGQADRKRVCIVGGSYGGYAALYEAGSKPELYKCAVSLDGLSDLNEDMAWERRTNGADSDAYRYWSKSQGDPSKDAARLTAASPITMVKGWKVPLLLIHGDADEIVNVEQSRRMNKALKAAGADVRYDEIKDMGHGPGTHKQWVQVLTEIDGFLGEHIKP
jgi:dienelactone hydrolase